MNTPSNVNLHISTQTLPYSEVQNWSSSSRSTFNSSPSNETLSQDSLLPLKVQHKDNSLPPSSPCSPTIYQDDDEDTNQYSWPYYAPERVSMLSSDVKGRGILPSEPLPKMHRNPLGNKRHITSPLPKQLEELHSYPRYSTLIHSPTSNGRPAHQLPSSRQRPLSNIESEASIRIPLTDSFQGGDSEFYDIPRNPCLFYPPQIVPATSAPAMNDKLYNTRHAARTSQASYAEARKSQRLSSTMNIQERSLYSQTAVAPIRKRESKQAKRMKETSQWVETVAAFAVGNDAETIRAEEVVRQGEIISKNTSRFDRLETASTIRVHFLSNSERDMQRKKKDEENVATRETTGQQLATDRQDLEQLREVTEKMAKELREAQELLTRLNDERTQKEQMIQEQETALRRREDELKRQEADLMMQQQLIYQQLSGFATTNDTFPSTSRQITGLNLATTVPSESKLNGPRPARSVHSVLSSVSTMSSISTVKSSISPKSQWDLYLESKNVPPPYVDPNATNRANLPSPSTAKIPDSWQAQSRRPPKLELWIPPVTGSRRSLPAVPISIPAHPVTTPMIIVTSNEKRGKTNEPPASRLSVIHETC